MLPAALMMVSPGASRARRSRSSSTTISCLTIRSVSPLITVVSNSPPFGSRLSGRPSFRPSTRCTLSRPPAISWATTAELVLTPCTMPARISSAISVVTPSCTLGPLPVTTTTFRPALRALTTASTVRSTAARACSPSPR